MFREVFLIIVLFEDIPLPQGRGMHIGHTTAIPGMYADLPGIDLCHAVMGIIPVAHPDRL